MRVWSATSLPSASVLWQAVSGAWSLTTIAKATFAIEPGEAPLAAVQEPIWDTDHYESGGALRSASDLAPFKLRPDILVVGSAFAPRPVSSLVARVVVGAMEKAIEIHTARWLDAEGQVLEGAPFSTMPLGWQKAAGGRDSTNPAGTSLDEQDRQGRTALPHQVAPGTRAIARGDYVEPIAFAPIPPGWPYRSQLAGAAGPAVMGGRWFEGPLPGDVHPAFFNVAPPDQQPDFLADDPRVILEHLSPRGARLAFSLAAIRVFCFLEGGRAAGRYAMRPDTLWIDTDRQLCCVTYRATIPLAELDAGLSATIMSDPPAPLTEASEVVLHARDDTFDASGTTMSTSKSSLFATDSLPFALSGAQPAAPSWPERESPPPPSPPSSPQPTNGPTGLPFQRKPAQTIPHDPANRTLATPFETKTRPLVPARPPPPATHSRVAPATVPPPSPGAHAVSLPPLNSPPLGLNSPPLVAPPLVAPPLVAPPLVAPPLVAPPRVPAPLAASGPVPPPRTPPPLPIAPPRASDGTVPSASPSQPGAPWAFQQQPEPPRKVVHEAGAVLSGVAGASNAAVDRQDGAGARNGAAAPAARPRPTSNDVVDLVWFEEDLPARVKRHDPWADAVRDERRIDDWVAVAETAERAPQDKDRRYVMRALGRVQPTEPATFGRLLTESVDEEGFIDRPLLVVAGELVMQFDPIEILKGSVELASQLAGGEKLKEALDAAREVSQAQRVTTPVVDTLLTRLRTTFAQSNRNLPADYLETTVLRTLLEERKYQQRKVLGGAHLLASFQAGNTTTTVYLPEHLAAQLPMVPRLKARLIVEPYPPQHPADGDGVALRTLALGRVIGSRSRGF